MRIRVPEKEGMIDKNEVLEFDRYCYRYLKKIGYETVVNVLHKYGISSGKIIDLGSGAGHLSIEISKSGGDYDIFAIDISREMTEKAISNIGKIKRINCVIADLHNIPFPDDSFDVAVSFASLHHWNDPASILKEVNRVVKNNGMVIIYDLKRDKKNLTFLNMLPSEKIKELLYASVHAAYKVNEIREILNLNLFSHNWQICENTMTIGVIGRVNKKSMCYGE